MIYHIYDLNKAYEGFIDRFGIEPNGILMHNETFTMLKEMMVNGTTQKVSDDALITFMGKSIFKSSDIEVGKLRFVI